MSKDENCKKKYNYENFVEVRVRNVPRQMKLTISQDRKQKGISESALIKNIISSHYENNPLRINPHFLED